MKRFVYNEKYAKMLVLMEGKKSQIDELSRQVDANSGHLRTVLEQWYKEGVINKDRPGRDYVITLTEKGSLLARKFAEIMQIVDKSVDEVSELPEDTDQEKVVDSETDPNSVDEADEEDKQVEYNNLIADGLSEAEARGTVWLESIPEGKEEKENV